MAQDTFLILHLLEVEPCCVMLSSACFSFLGTSGSIVVGRVSYHNTMGLEAVGASLGLCSSPGTSAYPGFAPVCFAFLQTSSLPPWGCSSDPQLLPANEWRSNYCHPISSPRGWVSLVTWLSVPPSSLLCFYPCCHAKELIPVWEGVRERHV